MTQVLVIVKKLRDQWTLTLYKSKKIALAKIQRNRSLIEDQTKYDLASSLALRGLRSVMTEGSYFITEVKEGGLRDLRKQGREEEVCA